MSHAKRSHVWKMKQSPLKILHGLESERYSRSQSEKGFLIRKLREKSIWEGFPEMGLPVGFLIRKGFLKRGSQALPVPTPCAYVF